MTDAPLIPLAQYIIERLKQSGVKQVGAPCIQHRDTE